MTHRVFVFGTLKEGFPNFAVNRGARLPGRYRTQAGPLAEYTQEHARLYRSRSEHAWEVERLVSPAVEEIA